MGTILWNLQSNPKVPALTRCDNVNTVTIMKTLKNKSTVFTFKTNNIKMK